MGKSRSTTWIMVVGVLLFAGAAVVTLRTAEQAVAAPARAAQSAAAPARVPTPVAAPASAAQAIAHPPPSAPEESATIHDDPTVAPDPAQSADHTVSFPTDI
ncbi:MAG TPA: hypothetical protein VMT29_12420 [Steroidobacteraceae bacterium]|nr:hypothetical protein [Steroidobacteraceae bacterium]